MKIQKKTMALMNKFEKKITVSDYIFKVLQFFIAIQTEMTLSESQMVKIFHSAASHSHELTFMEGQTEINKARLTRAKNQSPIRNTKAIRENIDELNQTIHDLQDDGSITSIEEITPSTSLFERTQLLNSTEPLETTIIRDSISALTVDDSNIHSQQSISTPNRHQSSNSNLFQGGSPQSRFYSQKSPLKLEDLISSSELHSTPIPKSFHSQSSNSVSASNSERKTSVVLPDSPAFHRTFRSRTAALSSEIDQILTQEDVPTPLLTHFVV
jgi:hypothetical protein